MINIFKRKNKTLDELKRNVKIASNNKRLAQTNLARFMKSMENAEVKYNTAVKELERYNDKIDNKPNLEKFKVK